MAEAAATAAPAIPGAWTKHVTCRYFMHGLCKEGINWRYSHDLNTSQPAAAMICKFFQKGNCVFGDRCRDLVLRDLVLRDLVLRDLVLRDLVLRDLVLRDLVLRDLVLRDLVLRDLVLRDLVLRDLVLRDLVLRDLVLRDLVLRDLVLRDLLLSSSPSPLALSSSPSPLPLSSSPPPSSDPVKSEGSGMSPLMEREKDVAGDDKELRKTLCPYAAMGECRYGLNCAYLHGDVCDMCGLQVLHPSNDAQRSEHTKACIEAHEKDMELSFAIQRSKDMQCGVCMEVVFDKANPSERRFGILSNCCHCYCLKCIRKWRSAKTFESKIIKSCPECRITSNFVIPSEYWVEDKEDKQKLIQKYKDGMGTKACRYFDQGRGTCPFGSNCFYKHAFPDGRLEEPQRRSAGCNGRNRNSRRTPLWDLFEERENSSDSLDNEDEEMVTFELSEMLLMLLATGTDDIDVTDSEDEWDLFHEELDDIYEIYL
ncbi:LOW QUALITY PROTEIN: probable E3 ubiquitin-protein ligase makorin-1 [Oncorhynchus keta]|uniref:LOW QUALITY PROTEIN: probable E3 ubiquitin-protein ligase makorin-1 n=1 Tax=Oncorhynchus keta TaxID=8018 RepID=UPI00227B555E|nr:LOW QUALITY PROTEIN: probable E3 ubiquitin-protein ligase makorin-1 [Oncorhynchus keta]